MGVTVRLDGESLTTRDLAAIAREGEAVTVSEAARDRVRASRDRVERFAAGDTAVYGLNTGFGELVSERIPPADVDRLQANLVRSHQVGVGEYLAVSVVRAMLATRVNALAKGHSGVREVVIDALLALLNEGVHPRIPRVGSLGASGDLAPLAHLAAVLMGEGEATYEGTHLTGQAALEAAGIDPVQLRAKEGIALINGTQLTAGITGVLLEDAYRLRRAATIAGAMTTEVTFATTATSDPVIADARPHPGHAATAQTIRALTDGSEILPAHEDCDRVQDAYSLRCIPQVHGAVSDAIDHLSDVVAVELNSATDNPLIFDPAVVDPRSNDTGVLSCGNFHGEPLALPLEYVRIALTELGTMSERRIDRMLNPNIQEPHLAPFLTERSGLQSGLMMAQYTAAALLNECRSVHAPVLDNAVVSGNQEDHVSMSATSAMQAAEVLERIRRVIAIELLCGAQALEFLDLAPGQGVQAVYRAIRREVPPLTDDRPLTEDIRAVDALIARGDLDAAVDLG